MQYRQGVFKSRVISWLTLLVFTMLSVMPFPGYAQQVSWDELRSQGLMVSDQLDDEGYRVITTDANRTVSLTAFDQGLTDKWKFNLGGNNLNFNVTGDAATTWSGTTNVLNGILGLFNSHGIHFTETSRINLTNAGFIGAAMRAVDGTSFNNLKLAGNGYLLNEGKISGGNIALLGGAVENKGAIDAPLNQVTIAGGKAMTVGLSGDNLISVVVDEATDTKVKDFDGKNLTDQIKDSGNIKAHKIKLDAKGVDGVFEKAINLTGEIQATNVNLNDKGEVELVAIGGIYNSGTIDSAKTTEHGYTFKNTGTLKGGVVLMDNTDGAADLSGEIGDPDEATVIKDVGDINLTGDVTLLGDVTMTADSDADGTGKITFSDGVSLSGSGSHYNLTLKASGQSIIRSMDDLGDLILTAQTAGARYTLRHSVAIVGDLEVKSNATLDGSFSVTVGGGSATGGGDIDLTGGVFTVLGDGTFGGDLDWGFNELVFGDGSTQASTQKVGDNDIQILQDWIINENHTLRGGSSTWDVAWGGGRIKDIIQIASGLYHGLALSANNGIVYSWGLNNHGQLGNGTTISRMTPTQVSGLSNVSQIAAGGYFSMALLDDGTVKSWGDNTYGQLGNNSTVDSSTPTSVTGLTNVTQVAAGQEYGLALLATGEVKSWGRNNSGQLGNGDNARTDQHTAVSVQGLTGVSKIAAGYEHALALLSTGTVKSWGSNLFGQLGNNTTTSSVAPVSVQGLSGITNIAAGAEHSLAVTSSKTVKGWGANGSGQLGVSNNPSFINPLGLTYRKVAVDVPSLSNVKSVAAGDGFSLALTNAGSVYSWGDNGSGQLGNRSTTNRTTPGLISSGTVTTQIIAGRQSAFALRDDGAVGAWGDNTYGELGDGTNVNRKTPIAVVAALNLEVSKLSEVKKISSGNGFSLALLMDGTIRSWGANSSGQLGNAPSNLYMYVPSNQYQPVAVNGVSNAIDIAAGGSFSMALIDDGTVKAWGNNTYGQLGRGTMGAAGYQPTTISGLSGVTGISAGNAFALALLNTGSVKSWGYNFSGQLGNGNNTNQSSPVNVSGVSNATAISAGFSHSLALLGTGSVVAWGLNHDGQLGDGTTNNSNVPVSVSNITNATAISAGLDFSLALLSDKKVKAWGYGFDGELGSGNNNNSNTPVSVLNLNNVVSIDAGDMFASAVLSDGSLWSWGKAYHGGQVYGSTPVQLTASNAVKVSSGSYGGVILLEDGTVQSWGSSAAGYLGANRISDAWNPIYVGGLVLDPFVNNGLFVPEDSTVSYSGDVLIGGRRVTTQIANANYNNLILKYQIQDYKLGGQPISEKNLKEITGGTLTISGERRNNIVDTKNFLDPSNSTRLPELLNFFGGDRAVLAEFVKMIFDSGRNIHMQELKAGVNEFEVTPQDLGMDQGMDQFQKMIFDAATQPEEERKVLDSEKQTDTVLATVTGNARVVSSDGKIYEAKPGMTLAKGDQVWTDSSAKVELSNKGDVVTVNSGSAVVVDSKPAMANDSNLVNSGDTAPVQDLLQIAFGKVSVAVSSSDGDSTFVVQTPNGMSGQRG